MSAALTVTAAPVGTAAPTKAGAAAGAEGFGGALSAVLAGIPAPDSTAPPEQPFAGDPAASAEDAAAPAAQLGSGDPAQFPPAVFQLPVTPAAALALRASETAPEAERNATTPVPDAEASALIAADALAGVAVTAPAGPGVAETVAAAQQLAQSSPDQFPPGTANSTPGQATDGAAGRAAEPGMPAPETRTAPLTVAPLTSAPGTAPAGTSAPTAAPVPQPATAAAPEPHSATNAAAVPAAVAQSTPGQPAAVQAGRANGYQSPVSAAPAAAENTPLYVPLAPQAAAAAVPAGTPTAAVPVPVPQNFAAQLVRPVFTLASAGVGEHSMTVAVNPENLGPVTVQAHISPAGIRVELFAANADGRDVLRQILPDLKRDLAGAGLNASLDLSSGNQPDSRQPDGGQGGREQFNTRGRAFAYPDGPDSRQLPVNEPTFRAGSLYGADGSLDVMA
jgi:flagellar hook-length control protein FliK